MPLTNSEHGIIEFRKMDYLLDEHHEKNNGKARLFYALGYTRERWEVLADDLRSQHLVLDAVEVKPNPHGRKFEIVGLLRGPAGEANIKSIWIIRHDEDFPRFVTAYKES